MKVEFYRNTDTPRRGVSLDSSLDSGGGLRDFKEDYVQEAQRAVINIETKIRDSYNQLLPSNSLNPHNLIVQLRDYAEAWRVFYKSRGIYLEEVSSKDIENIIQGDYAPEKRGPNLDEISFRDAKPKVFSENYDFRNSVRASAPASLERVMTLVHKPNSSTVP